MGLQRPEAVGTRHRVHQQHSLLAQMLEQRAQRPRHGPSVHLVRRHGGAAADPGPVRDDHAVAVTYEVIGPSGPPVRRRQVAGAGEHAAVDEHNRGVSRAGGAELVVEDGHLARQVPAAVDAFRVTPYPGHR